MKNLASMIIFLTEIRTVVKKVMQKHFRLIPSYENTDQVVFSSRLLYEFLKDHLQIGEGAYQKRIPPLFLDLKKEKIAAFLRGYYEGDGSVSISDIRVTCDTVSAGLVHDLSFVLSRFGIFTKFYEYETTGGDIVKVFYIRKNRSVPIIKMTKIIIPSSFVNKFKPIHFLSERKRKIFDALCKKN